MIVIVITVSNFWHFFQKIGHIHEDTIFSHFSELTNRMKLSVSLLAASVIGASAFSTPGSFSRPSTALNTILTKKTGSSPLDPAVIAKYDALSFPEDSILAEYVWVDAKGETRSKTRTLPAAKGESVESLPKWNFDGSSTDQAPGDDSEVILRPCRIFKDPFRPRSDGKNNILVMCDTWTPAGVSRKNMFCYTSLLC